MQNYLRKSFETIQFFYIFIEINRLNATEYKKEYLIFSCIVFFFQDCGTLTGQGIIKQIIRTVIFYSYSIYNIIFVLNAKINEINKNKTV